MTKTRITRVQAKEARGESIRVMLYNRVSGSKQEEEGTSLETQREVNTQYANEHGYIIVDTVNETHTGFELEERKKFMNVLERCKSNEADAIVFSAYDRLSRNKTHFTVILYEAQRYGYELFCVNEQFDEDNIYERMLREIVAIFAELERHKIAKRTKEGKIKRVEAGKLLNGKKPRYGYTYADDKRTYYKIVESEAAIIRRIDMLYLEGYGQQHIADILTKDGIPTPTGNKIWGRTTVGLILTCTEYHGVGYAYNTSLVISETGKKQHIQTPIEERIQLPKNVYPIIRPHETYLAIQHRLQNAHSTAITCHIPENVLLRGLIHCAICGRIMRPKMERNSEKRAFYQYLIYKCQAYANSNHKDIHSVQIAANSIEPAVIKYISELLKDLGVIERALISYINNHSSEASVESYDNAIEQLKAQQEEIGNDLLMARGNVRKILLAQMNKLEEEIEKLKKHKKEINGDGDKWERIKKDIYDVIAWIQQGKADIDTASFEEKRRILKALGIVVFVSKTEKIKGVAPRNAYEIRVTLHTLDSTSQKNGRS